MCKNKVTAFISGSIPLLISILWCLYGTNVAPIQIREEGHEKCPKEYKLDLYFLGCFSITGEKYERRMEKY